MGSQKGDEARLKMLNEVNDEIEQLLPALMLSPRGPYERLIRNLIVELQEAAGRDGGLDDDHQDFRDRLVEHAANLEQVRRELPNPWPRIGELVFSLDDGDTGAARRANASARSSDMDSLRDPCQASALYTLNLDSDSRS